MDEDYRCMLVIERDKQSVCGLDDGMDPVTFRDNCKGNLTKRPDWCPLTKVIVPRID